MIVDKLFFHSKRLVKYQKIIRAILWIMPLILLKVDVAQKEVISREPIHAYIKSSKIDISNASDGKDVVFTNGKFILNGLPPRTGLRIRGKSEQEECFRELIPMIERMNIKGMNIIVDLNCPSVDDCTYLLEMNVSFGKYTCMWTHPLRNHQPNSDLMMVAGEFFCAEAKLDLVDLFLTNFPSNSIEISLKKCNEDIELFLKLIKAISSIRTHPYGTYFYIPFRNSYINAPIFLPSVAFILTYYIFDWFCVFYTISVIRISFGSFLYFFCPLSGLLFLRRNEALCFIAIFMAFNFKFGLLYAMLNYIRMTYDILHAFVPAIPEILNSLQSLRRMKAKLSGKNS